MRTTRTNLRPRLAIGLLLAPLCVAIACEDSGDGAATPASGDEQMSREERIEFRRQLQEDQIPDLERVAADSAVAITGEVPQDLIDSILADLGAVLGVSTDNMQIVRSEAKRWNSGALGCPEPGQMYTQSLVDGYQVVIDHDGDLFDYRATTEGFFKMCTGPGAAPGVAPPKM